MSGGAVPAAFIATATSTNANPLDWQTNNDWRPFEIYLSDRRVTVGGQLYLPRLVAIGEAGSDVLISQDIKGASDNVRFAFGNADRIMTQLANDSDLKYADIDLCLFHVNSGILLQLWKGVIQNFQSDGTPVFPVTCSDGFFQIMNQYPERQISRQCWKTFNDGLYCPYATCGSGGDPATCDYYLESVNGCQAHGMAPFFGGHQADPQGVVIKDDSTGFLGFGRNTVTATSIISDTVWGLALPEIWCNSGGDPIKAFIAPAQLVAYRDESGYSDALGILGAGPIGGFSPSQVAQNADGYRFVVGPMLDGYLWQGFKVDGNLNVTKNQPGMGLRQIQGNDPANPNTDSFSLGQGTPQVWEPNVFAAGTAACEIRVVKDTTITPSTPDQHQMKVPIDYGLSGWVWDASGNRSAALGLVNPFWIAVNMLLRALGVPGSVPTPLLLTNIAVTLPPSSFYNFGGSTVGVFKILAYIGNPVGYIGLLVATIGSAFTGNAFSVPMSDAANQAQNVLGQNLAAWQSMAAIYRTTANRATFVANFDAIWNAFVGACNVIIGGDPNGSDAKKALNASIGDRQRGGKFDWFASYRDPIANSATPGDSISTPDLSAQQLSKFVLSSLVVGDGSGAAEIAAAQVPAILGTGNETQFQFQGVLSAQKPFRDWLTEVLNCCLGFYTWEFGKLKLGCRINASVVDTYTTVEHPVPEPAIGSDPGGLRAPGDVLRRCCLSVSGEHGRVLRQEPRRLLRPRRIASYHPDAFRGLLHAQPGAQNRGDANARGDRRRESDRVAQRADGDLADHAAGPGQRGRPGGLDHPSGRAHRNRRLPDSAVEPEEGLVGRDPGSDRHRLDVRPGRRAEAHRRGARAPAAPVLPDPARAGVGALPGAGGLLGRIVP